MANQSKIEWTEATWNPVTGCTRASAGCDNCYAVTMTRRLAAMGQEAKYGGLINDGKKHFNGVVKCHPADLSIPLARRKPTMYFVNSMSDLFHDAVPFEFIDQVFATMAMCPQHTFQVLTKRPARMLEYFNHQVPEHTARRVSHVGITSDSQRWAATKAGRWWPLHNVWLGVSVENQEQADKRIPLLLQVPAAVRWLSCEPLLGPLDLWKYLGEQVVCPVQSYGLGQCPTCKGAGTVRGIDWVVVGGEAGPGARPMHPLWAHSLRDECAAEEVPFLFKQHGDWAGICELGPGEHDKLYVPKRRNQLARLIDQYGPEQGEEACRELYGQRCTVPTCTINYDGTPYELGAPPQPGLTMLMFGLGKKAAGRLLDGQQHDGYPAPRGTGAGG
jgi:protein gp37